MSVNFYDLCRICTKFADEKIHIFSAENRRKNLCAKIGECLPLNIEEKDRLPKVLCSQCLQHVENIKEFREICKKSQMTLNTWLNSAANNGAKTYIKDEISPSSGKSLSVLSSSTAAATTSNATVTTTAQMPMVTYTATPLGNNEILNSIMQVGGLQSQQTIELNQNDKQQTFPQYTITVDKNLNRATQQAQQLEKDAKANALEEFLKLKPNIKVTPIRKDAQKQQQQQTQIPMQTQQQTTQTQPQQITVQAQQITLPAQTQTATIPQQISQLQLQQLIQQQLQQQWQQQQLQQHLQQLTTQFQPQQITITAPTPAQANVTPTASITPNTSLNESLSPSKSKKQKLNFVLTPPTANQTANTFQQLTGTNVAATSTAQQPQIQLHLQPNTQQLQSLQPQQQQQQQTTTNAANILTNLAPLLQQSVNMTAPLSAATGSASLLSPNKCFLPITIKDESSDQQIVAHIDAKNFVFPTTYQLQMKLQPQIATVDGQTLMLQPTTTIPATLQLTPQALTNQTFQALLNSNQLQQPQIMQQVQPQQQQQQEQHQQQQLQQIQFSQSMPTTNNLQITSQQILRTANDSNTGGAATVDQQENQRPKTQTQNTISQQKFKITQLPGNAFEITPTNDYETSTTATNKPPITQTTVQQKVTPPKQQQAQNQVTIPTSLPTQYGGITVQRISTSTKVNNQTNQKSQEPQQQQQLSQANKPALKIEATTAAKSNVWQKQNLTISRIPATQQQAHQSQSKSLTTAVKATPQNQKLLLQPPQSSNSPAKMQTQQLQQQQVTTQQQNQYQQAPTAQQSSPKKVVRRVAGKTAPAVTKQAPQQIETAAIIKIESLPALAKSLTLTTAPSTTTTPTSTTTTRVTIKKENVANFASKSAASSTENNSSITVAANTNTAAAAPTPGFECGRCHRVFKKKEHLTQHAKLHDGIRPFKCTQAGCDKDFSRKEHLLRHIVSHSGEKQFSCDVCEKPFSRKDNLNKHRRIHTSAQNASSYTCEVCNKSFAIKLHYEEHRELHVKHETETKAQTKKPVKTQQRTVTIQQQQNHQQQQQQHQQQQQQHQQQPQQIQFVQHQAAHHPQQTMHLQLPTVVTTQDLAGNTITITQSTDPNKAIGNHDTTVLNLPSHLANFVQLGQTQFVNTATGQISHIKFDKS